MSATDQGRRRLHSDQVAIDAGVEAAEKIAWLKVELAAWEEVARSSETHAAHLALVDIDDAMSDCDRCSSWRPGHSPDAPHTCGLDDAQRAKAYGRDAVIDYERKEAAADRTAELLEEARSHR